MADSVDRSGLAQRLTSRRGARISLAIAVVAFLALFGLFGRAEAPGGNQAAPDGAESTQVAQLLEQFPGADQQSVLIVASADDGGDLTQQNLDALGEVSAAAADFTGGSATEPQVSEDGQAAVISTPITVGEESTETAETIEGLREAISSHVPDGLTVQVTGGPAFAADVASAFDGANFTLLAVTILIVAVLLIVTYRSPVLWLIPLAVVGLADQIANKVTAAAGSAFDLQFDAGIISVLVFGAGTNYALLLISRYREELSSTQDHRAALARAWRHTAPAILASNVTVVLALLTLVLAVIPGTHGLGVASAIGLVIALAAVLFALPPALAMCGRRIFWPFKPVPGGGASQGRFWHGVAARVSRRPVVGLVGGVLVLAIMAAGWFGTSIGLTQVEKFRVQSESAAGLEVVSEHFPPGESQPMIVVADSAQAEEVVAAADDVDGVVRAHAVEQSTNGALTKIRVVGDYAPGTDASLDLVEDLRGAVHEVPGAHALVGGQTATEFDARAGTQHDLFLVAPLILAVAFVILTVLLRSAVAPILLLIVNLGSALAAIGGGAWLSRQVFTQDALDSQVPLLAFLFLVALGIDYTIFLVHRARTEAAVRGTRQGIVQAVTHTGGVITSAGIVLAGVFAALGVLPLVVLGQLGLIVGLGVLVDTLIVRTVIVPAVFTLVGDRIWWPRTPAAGHTPPPQVPTATSGAVSVE